MTALSRTQPDAGYAGRRLTADEFFALGETTERLELFDGIIIVSPSPFPIHQALADELQTQLGLARRGGLRIVVFPDTDVQFAPNLVYRPDITVYRAERMPK